MKEFKSILEFQKHFDTDEKCREHLEQSRWNGTPACPFCGSLNVCRFKTGKAFNCRDCRKNFSVTVGTIYENSKLSLTIWYLATYILTNHSKGISSLQLAGWLGVTQKTAWFLNHRIRQMLTNNAPELLEGVVEVDETYIGGSESNKHASKKRKKGEPDNVSRMRLKEKPKQYAFQMLKNDVLNAVKKNQLSVPDSYVANEFIFGLIDSFTNYFGFDKFIPKCDLNYLKFLIEKVLPVVEAENTNYREGLTELETCIDGNERHFSNADRIKKAIKLIEQGHISKVKVKLYSNKFDFILLYYYISLLEGKGFTEAVRNLEPNKTPTPIGTQSWNGWDRNIVYKNVKNFYENFFRSYELLIKTNFENLIDELNIKEDGDLVIVKIRDEFGKPFLERFFLKSLMPNSSTIQQYVIFHSKDCPLDMYKMHQQNDYTFRYEGVDYKVILQANHPLDFLFDKLPFFQYANEILLKKLSDFFSKMSS